MPDRSSSAMSDSPASEFEIVLGNKQLFSLLFIVFVLLGVFFAMGYMMGRNTVPAPVDTVARTAESSGTRPSSVSEPKETAPTTPAATPEETPAAPVVEPKKVKEKEEPVSSSAGAAPAALTVVEPKPGQTFLQVSAITRPEAELLVDVLQKKGFRAVLAPGPKETIFRVLVGPEKDDAELAKVRTQLEQSGFKPIPRRY